MKKIHRRLIIVLLVLFVVFVLYSKIISSENYFLKHLPNVNFSQIETPNKRFLHDHTSADRRKTKTILLFTTHFYSDVWKGLEPEVLDGHLQRQNCVVKDCEVTYNKASITTADVVVFHGVDFTYKNFTSKHFHELSKKRPPYQIWVFWMHEPPVYVPLYDNYDNLFNWTMTFSRQSDIYLPYYSYSRLTNDDEKPGKYLNYATQKSKKVAWMVSHCGMTRSSYVTELQKYTDVTVYGLCGSEFDNVGGICSRVEYECMQELSQYKFFLSFENSFCQDYVTEKYYKLALIYGLVPIVMGANYDNMNSIPGSFIDVSRFSSIKDLGNYINFLDSNDHAYNMYFAWKKHFKVTEGIDKICMICHAVHEPSREIKTYSSFHSFWSVENLCEPYDMVITKLEHQIAESKENSKKQSSPEVTS